MEIDQRYAKKGPITANGAPPYYRLRTVSPPSLVLDGVSELPAEFPSYSVTESVVEATCKGIRRCPVPVRCLVLVGWNFLRRLSCLVGCIRSVLHCCRSGCRFLGSEQGFESHHYFFNAIFACPEFLKRPENIVQFRVRRVKRNAINISTIGLHIDLSSGEFSMIPEAVNKFLLQLSC
jgi:hypothetical protein